MTRLIAGKDAVRTSLTGVLSMLWGSWVILLFLKALQHQSAPQLSTTGLSLALILVHVFVTVVLFLACRPPKLGFLIIGAFFARLFVLFVDRLGSAELPFLGEGDADGFFAAASSIAADLSLAGDIYGGTYTELLGYMFHFVGVDRFLGQYLNVLLSLTTIVLIAGILRQLDIGARAAGIALGLSAFMPMLVIHSSILLREMFIQVLVTAALYAFVKGLISSKYIWTLTSVLLILGASLFHAGVIGVLIGFAVVSAFTYQNAGRLGFGLKRLGPALVLVFGIAIVLIQYPDLFLGKFQTLDSPDDLLEHGLTGRGGSAYLRGMEVTNWWTFLIYSPIRAFYFIAAPMPWDWRGLNDVIAFGLDASIYIAIISLFFIRKIEDPNRRYIAYSLALVLLVTTLVFGIGVSNSGTALRHRVKLIAIFMTLLAVILDSSKQKKTGKNRGRRTRTRYISRPD